MGIFHGLRGVTDMGLLAATAKNAEQYAKDNTYESLALSLGKRVVGGSCDPVIAEAALNDHLAVEREDFIDTKKAERGAKALERLTLSGVIDPLFAEDMLDSGFSTWSVRGALEQMVSVNTEADRSA